MDVLFNSMKGILHIICVRVLSCFSHVRLFGTPWTIDHQVPLSMGLSRHEYWSGLPCPPSGDFLDPGIKPISPVSPALSGGFFTTRAPVLYFKYLVILFVNYTSVKLKKEQLFN